MEIRSRAREDSRRSGKARFTGALIAAAKMMCAGSMLRVCQTLPVGNSLLPKALIYHLCTCYYFHVIEKELFRKKLRARYSEISEKNPRFSLRAFSKKTGLSASILSRVINGKRNLSLETMIRVSQVLDIEFADTESDSRPSSTINIESFRVISDWYHFAIIELMRTKTFKSDEKWISKRLGLPLAIVQAALDRMESLALIERPNGQIRPSSNAFLKTTDDLTSAAIQKHHRQMLEKAAEALDDAPKDREFRALNLSFDPAETQEAKKMIRDFYKKFNNRFSKANGKEVFQLNLQFFRLTKEIK